MPLIQIADHHMEVSNKESTTDYKCPGQELQHEQDTLNRRVRTITSSLAYTSSEVLKRRSRRHQWTCSNVTVVILIAFVIIWLCSRYSLWWMVSFQETMSSFRKTI